jgi:hypothetical protein
MATFDRTTIVRGPCKITYDGATFYSKGGVTFTATNSSFDKETDAYGPVGKIKTDFQVVVEFEPVGEIEALTTLFPYASTAMGASICGATDKPLVIVSASATYTVLNAIVTQMPSLRLSATATAFGSVQFTGLLKKEGDPSNLEHYYTIGAGASIGVAFDTSKIVCGAYYCDLGAFDEVYSESGFEVSFDLSMNPVIVDGFGTVDMSLTSLGSNLSFIPTGIARADLEVLLEGTGPGGNVSGIDFISIQTPTVGGIILEFRSGELIDIQDRFSPTDNRLGTINITATREIASGVPEPLFTIEAVTS